ncbi:NUDIX hydrolase [Halalkalibacter sp. APA_J-10(15)]|uniref:NUDIX hydrolase n=1 Tax=Halalkalibacter sp. APA_J-10(15) TaxID=2933805 RepID=UPI001FF4B197|nr:NUDIX hydrolase [Halalkalibacter sp. APA_J-10(15)]MCK0470073.1 NUDIX hydrolase [Halalkalibacter sp. APA_J-10(15)]
MDYIQHIRSIAGSQPLILTAASMIVIDDEGRVLLQHRTDTNTWGLPGGFMELGESIEEAARRELKEETGLTVHGMELFDVFSGKEFYFQYPNGDEVYNVIVSFVTKEVSGDILIDHESHDVRYFSFDELPEQMIPTTRKMIERYKREQGDRDEEAK